jgi:hypothetical protein
MRSVLARGFGLMRAVAFAVLIASGALLTPAANSQTGCTQERAAELARPGNSGNDPCLVHWRAIEVRKHPERATLLECNGLKAYEDPQPPGHPVPLAECDRIIREDQQRMGLPANGMGDELKAGYRSTWGQ